MTMTVRRRLGGGLLSLSGALLLALARLHATGECSWSETDLMPITSQVSGQPVYFTSSGTVDTYSNGHAEGVIQTSHTGPEHSSSTHYIISDDNRIIANGYVSEGFCDSGTGFANWSADNVSGNILMQTETTVFGG